MADFHSIVCRDCGRVAFVPSDYVVCCSAAPENGGHWAGCWGREFEAWHESKSEKARKRLDENG